MSMYIERDEVLKELDVVDSMDLMVNEQVLDFGEGYGNKTVTLSLRWNFMQCKDTYYPP